MKPTTLKGALTGLAADALLVAGTSQKKSEEMGGSLPKTVATKYRGILPDSGFL